MINIHKFEGEVDFWRWMIETIEGKFFPKPETSLPTRASPELIKTSRTCPIFPRNERKTLRIILEREVSPGKSIP